MNVRISMYDFEHFPDREHRKRQVGFFPQTYCPCGWRIMDFLSPPEVIAALQNEWSMGSLDYPMVTKEMKRSGCAADGRPLLVEIDQSDILSSPASCAALT